MVTNEIRSSLKQALTELRIAEHELNRPHEEVVTMSVCYSARQSMTSMLRVFLLSHSMNHNEGNSLKNILNQCIKIDDQFSKIDVSAVLCNGMNHDECDGKYCLTVDKVNECVSAANQFKTLVLEKLKINESELN